MAKIRVMTIIQFPKIGNGACSYISCRQSCKFVKFCSKFDECGCICSPREYISNLMVLSVRNG